MDPIGLGKNGHPVLRVYIQPRASKSRCCGFHSDALKLAIAAPPVDGKANKAVVRFVADLFGVGPRDVVLISGKQSRSKTIGFLSLTEEELRHRLGRLLG